MPRKSLKVASVGVIMLVICATLALVTQPQSGNCESPLFIGAHYGPDALSVASLIQRAGGLPKSNAEVKSGLNFSQAVSIYPVSRWEIEKVSVWDKQPLWNRISDDDPTYGIAVDLRVHYANGGRGVLRWNTWRYGLVLCPFVLGYGDGPPGRLELIDLK